MLNYKRYKKMFHIKVTLFDEKNLKIMLKLNSRHRLSTYYIIVGTLILNGRDLGFLRG